MEARLFDHESTSNDKYLEGMSLNISIALLLMKKCMERQNQTSLTFLVRIVRKLGLFLSIENHHQENAKQSQKTKAYLKFLHQRTYSVKHDDRKSRLSLLLHALHRHRRKMSRWNSDSSLG